MEKAENVEYVLRELERLKVEIQRLESMLMPVLRDDDITFSFESLALQGGDVVDCSKKNL